MLSIEKSFGVLEKSQGSKVIHKPYFSLIEKYGLCITLLWLADRGVNECISCIKGLLPTRENDYAQNRLLETLSSFNFSMRPFSIFYVLDFCQKSPFCLPLVGCPTHYIPIVVCRYILLLRTTTS